MSALGTLNTLILALSAITTLLAWVSCKVGQFGKFKFFHACTLAARAVVLCVKMYEYHDKWIHYEIKLTNGLHSPTATWLKNDLERRLRHHRRPHRSNG